MRALLLGRLSRLGIDRGTARSAVRNIVRQRCERRSRGASSPVTARVLCISPVLFLRDEVVLAGLAKENEALIFGNAFGDVRFTGLLIEVGTGGQQDVLATGFSVGEHARDDDAPLVAGMRMNRAGEFAGHFEKGAMRAVRKIAFLRFPISDDITPERMRDYVQCIIRDSARHTTQPNYYIIEGAQSWTVSDQLMKKEIILQGAAWGHLHDFLIERELRDGRLLSIAGRHLKGGRVELTAARRRDLPHGPIATRLWQHIAEQAPTFSVMQCQ
jgi:hypothetical protein